MSCADGEHTIEVWRGRDVCIECGVEPNKPVRKNLADLDIDTPYGEV